MLNRRVIVWLMVLVVAVPVVAGGIYWLVWDHFYKYQPTTITHNQAEIQKLLDEVDYVSPGHTGQPIYVITYRTCQPCRAFEEQEFPKYDAVNVDTRIIPFARADANGLPQSTPAERTTVAELWITRKWAFYQAWFASSDSNWKADGLVPADTDLARTAVVGASRDFNTQLNSLLAASNVRVSYPLVIWRDQYNRLKVCPCSDQAAYAFVRADFNAPGQVGPDANPLNGVLNAIGVSGASTAPAGSENASPQQSPPPSSATPANSF